MSEVDQKSSNESVSNGRRALMLGAVGASAVLSIRPALAQVASSVTNCRIPIPDPARSSNYIAADGSLVPPGTVGAFAPPGRSYSAQEIKAALTGSALPGSDYTTSQAYINYVRRLQAGQSGFTCYASLQMPGR
jgi:hypothetical protein